MNVRIELKQEQAITQNSIHSAHEKIMQTYAADLLSAADLYAADNVLRGRGGPFGASLHVFTPAGDDVICTQIGGLAANAVLETGMGSAHAEDRLLCADNIAALKKLLSGSDRERALIVLTSSGESCPACHAKEEILARDLRAEGFITSPDQFLVIYGASYEDTAEIAGFNDLPYLHDMQKDKGRAVTQSFAALADLPFMVRAVFEVADKPVCVIAKDGEVLGIGYDTRDDKDVLSTAELSAIRDACRAQKEKGSVAPWDLGQAALYSSTKDIGPLAYAECLWANIAEFVSVEHPRAQEFATVEAPQISNADFFKAITTRPYNGERTALRMQRGKDFANKAQHTWKEKIAAESAAGKSSRLYNGTVIND